MGPIIGMLGTSEILDRYDRQRKPEFRELKFSAVQMLTVLTYIEVKQTTAEGFVESMKGRGGGKILSNLGMPRGRDGRFICPSAAWIS